MHIVVTGINHKTAPIDIREQFYLNETERDYLLTLLQSDPSVMEALVLSTCNRTEIYAHLIDPAGEKVLLNHLFKIKKRVITGDLKRYFYRHEGKSAIEHFMRVCAGLDSIVLGEKQILGQVKNAVERARGKGMTGKCFNILAATAIKAGKKAQHETQISYGGVSVSWASVTMAKRVMGTFKHKSFLIIGAGKMGHLAAGHLKNKGADNIFVMNRSLEKAKVLADKFGGTPVSFWDIKEVLREVDVCICSAGAPHYLLEKAVLEKVMPARPNRPMLCVDISIPRNIEPAVSTLNNVSLITIDDLGDVVAENMEKRYSALSQVEEIISAKIGQYQAKMEKINMHNQFRVYETAGL